MLVRIDRRGARVCAVHRHVWNASNLCECNLVLVAFRRSGERKEKKEEKKKIIGTRRIFATLLPVVPLSIYFAADLFWIDYTNCASKLRAFCVRTSSAIHFSTPTSGELRSNLLQILNLLSSLEEFFFIYLILFFFFKIILLR